MTTVYIVRHGESITNLEKRFAGQLDVPLTEKGKKQAEVTADYLRNVPFSSIYSSRLQRAFETAQSIARPHNLPVQTAEGILEINAGKWQGRLIEELTRDFPKEFHIWKTDIGNAVCPDGESMVDLQKRVVAAVRSIVEKHPDETICMVAHGGVIRVLLAYVTNTPMEELYKGPTWVTNASVSVVNFDEDGDCHLVQRDYKEHLRSIGTQTLNAL